MPTGNAKPRTRGTLRDLRDAMASWRTASVSLLSFSSGLPLGLVWIAIPDWMRDVGFDIRIVGLTTLAHAPWTFKMVWSPLMDRYPLRWLGRRRGWIAVTQVILLALTLLLAGVGGQPETPWIILALSLALAFASASQDIVIDAYAVDVLRPEERGVAVGARTAVYRVAMQIAGAVSITAASKVSWPVVCVALASMYLPMLFVTVRSPEPEVPSHTPRTLKESVWLPFLGFLSRHRALEILAFVFFYKFSDMLAQTLMRPFFNDMGYSAFHRGLALGTVGAIGTIVGTFVGGALTTVIGLGRCLWIFGFLQIASNVGYILVSQSGVNYALFYGAMTFETLTTGTGMGAFGVLLLRMTQRRFSATQYALFSSLFAVPRLISGPLTGLIVHAVGWTNFFWFTMAAGIPGLVLLARFVPLTCREPEFTVEPPRSRQPLSGAALAGRGLLGGLVGGGFALLVLATLGALEAMKDDPAGAFDLGAAVMQLVLPADVTRVVELLGCLVVGLVCALCIAAVSAARHGAGREYADDGADVAPELE